MKSAARTTFVVTGLMSWGLLGCAPPDAFPGGPVGAPPHRPADGLLSRPDLQALVDLQEARDGAALVAHLQDADPLARARAAFALGSVQDPAAASALVGLLSDPEPHVRADAAFALGQLAEPPSGPLVDALQRESDVEVRTALIEAIGKRGDPGAVAALLSQTGAGTLATATEALSRAVIRGVQLPEVVDTLVKRLTHPDPAVRVEAAYFLSRTKDRGVWVRQDNVVRGALDGYAPDEPAAAYVLQGLSIDMDIFSSERVVNWLGKASDWRARVNAAVALASEDALSAAASEALLRALDDPSPHVRQAAAETLAQKPPLEGVPGRVRAWVETHPDDSAADWPLLGLLAEVGQGDLLVARMRETPLTDEDPWLRGLHELGRASGREALDQIARALASPHPRVARAALTAMRQRWRLSRGFEESHQGFFEALTAALDSARGSLVGDLADLLADPAFQARGSADVLIALYERLEAGPPKNRVGRVLSGLDDPRAQALVSGALAQGGGAAVAGDEGDARQAPTRRERRRNYRTVDWAALSRLGPRPRLVLETELGTVVLRLATEEAPLTVMAIAELALAGRYDGVPFHRVVPNFVIQGGAVSGAGDDGPGFTLRSEFTRIPYRRGVLGMASSGKDTETSQFFITHAPSPHLDGAYTAFGWVERGRDVVDRIQRGDVVVHARIIPGF